MGEVYHAAYERRSGRWEEVGPVALCRPEVAPPVEGEQWLGCGNGFAAYGPALRARYGRQLVGLAPGLTPHAREVCRLGAQVLQRGQGVSPEQAAPIYVREKVALSVAERAALRESSARTSSVTGMP
jgi:tRNA threonylcarbamoyladenosine biosynthesis protein TsaB